jgi:putative ABC transport system substrate-binding protein
MSLAKAFVIFLALGLLAAPFPPDAQPQPKVHRIGLLMASNPAGTAHFLNAFREGLRELGYVEGQNILLERRYAEGRPERLPDLAAEMVRLKVDVIVTSPDLAIQAAKQVTKTVPIVMAHSFDPVGSGLVASLARPGGNVTGSSVLATELSGKRLELLKEVVPELSRVALLGDPAAPISAIALSETERAAQALGVKLQYVEVRGPADFNGAFAAIARARAGLIVPPAINLFFANRSRIVELAAKHRLPGMYGVREFVEIGGFMSYGPNVAHLFRRAATYVDKILKGTKPADLPVEQPTRFELVVNLKTAKALGLTIPPSILIRADHVIQ